MRCAATAALAAAILTFGLIVLGAVGADDQLRPVLPRLADLLRPLGAAARRDRGHARTGYSYGQVMLEWAHRLIAGVLLGPLVLVLAVLAFLARRRAPTRRLPAGVGSSCCCWCRRRSAASPCSTRTAPGRWRSTSATRSWC